MKKLKVRKQRELKSEKLKQNEKLQARKIH